ncbi:hypothetical protein ACQUJO_02835 [Ralstonia pseudosolanacearum]
MMMMKTGPRALCVVANGAMTGRRVGQHDGIVIFPSAVALAWRDRAFVCLDRRGDRPGGG